METEFAQPGSGRSPHPMSATAAAAASRARAHLYRHSPRRPGSPTLDTLRLAHGLGWFGVLSGVAALLAPRTVGSAVGLGSRNPAIARAIGLRELTSGVGILSRKNPAPWLWLRTAGDVVDLAVLADGLRPGNPGRGKAAFTLATVAGILALDAFAATHLTRHARHPLVSGTASPTDLYFETSIATSRSPEECYLFWRNFDNLPRFMHGLESVQRLDERRFHWVTKGSAQIRSEWDSEITEDRPSAALAWRSSSGAQIPNAGSVIFEPIPHERGTIVRFSIHYSPIGGRLTAGLARLLRQDPQSQVNDDLRRFKQLLETGEIATTHGQPTGRRSLAGRAARLWGLTSSN